MCYIINFIDLCLSGISPIFIHDLVQPEVYLNTSHLSSCSLNQEVTWSLSLLLLFNRK